MPKVEEIAKFVYRYKCECGKTITLHTDEKPNRLVKCFDCISKGRDLKKEEKKNE